MKSIKKNYIYNTIYQILNVLTPLITAPYISRVLGAGGIGRVSYAQSIVSYFTLFATMGIYTYGQREISYVQDNIEKRSVIFWNTNILKLFTSSLMLLLYLVFSFYQDDNLIFIILSLNILAVTFDITWFFQGLEEFEKIVFRNIVFKAISMIYTFAVIRTADDVIAWAFGNAFFVFVSNVSLWGYLPKYIKRTSKNFLDPFKDLKIVLALFVPSIAVQVYTVLDKTMIGIITNNSFENGYYEQALNIVRMLLAIITSLSTVLIPRIGYYFKENNHEKVRVLMYQSYSFVWLLAVPMCLGLIGISDNIVPWFFGPGYNKVSFLLKILAFLFIAISLSNITGLQYLLPTKKEKYLSTSVIFGAAVNFVANIILIFKFGAVGAAIASVMAEAVVTAVQFIFVRKELSLKVIFESSIKYWLSGCIMMIVLYFENLIFVSSIVNTFIMVLSGAIVYFAMLLILKDEFFLENMNQILSKLIKDKLKR